MKKKLLTIFALLVVMVALVVVSVMGTIAFMTASAAVSNTFTVGDVAIHMYESKVTNKGQDRVADDPSINGAMKDSDGNNYHLMPGLTYVKDPTIYVNANCDEAYLFVKVRNNISTIEATDAPTIAQQLAAHGWQEFINTSTGMVYLYTGVNSDGTDLSGDDLTAIQNKTREPKVVGGTAEMQSIDVFDSFKVATNADVKLYGGAKVTLTAFAIQADSFENKDGKTAVQHAWDAIVAAYPYENGTQISE